MSRWAKYRIHSPSDQKLRDEKLSRSRPKTRDPDLSMNLDLSMSGRENSEFLLGS